MKLSITGRALKIKSNTLLRKLMHSIWSHLDSLIYLPFENRVNCDQVQRPSLCLSCQCYTTGLWVPGFSAVISGYSRCFNLTEYLSHLGNIATANDLSKGTGTSHVAYYVMRITCLMWRGFLRLL